MEDKTSRNVETTDAPKQEPQEKAAPVADTPRARQLERAKARTDLAAKFEAEEAENDDVDPPEPAAKPAATPARDPDVKAPAGRARTKRRHIGLMVFFVQLVIIPMVLAGWYLYFVAHDQYASKLGFSVRKEEIGSAIEVLGGITELSGSSSKDTDILYEFIQSQNIVRAVSLQIDLNDVYNVPGDPIFTLGDDTRIEALADYWGRMVTVFYDRSSGLIEIRVKAFDPEHAQRIASLIYDESNRMINDLSDVAQADATRYATEELDEAIERLKNARSAITAFRTRTQIVDPLADIQGRMGLLNTLQAQLAEALIELDLTRQATGRDDDPRVVQGQRRVQVIEDRIRSERSRFSEGSGTEEGQAYPQLVGEYEGLAVDQQFAEQAYVAALAAFNAATSDAQRQSRYLASYLEPTVAETALYPRRAVLMGTIFFILFVAFSIITMITYSFRDRK